MFRRKQDVDRHVQRILGKIKDEREKQARGYQIAKLYFEVGEFEIARRYLASYLSVRDSVPLAYKLLGDIEEKFENKLNALDAYKRFISTGGSEKEIVLKICKLNAEIDADPEVCRVWLEKAEKLFPQSDEVYKLKEKVEEKLLQSGSKERNAENLEKLISTELVKRPHDVELRIKLLRHYLMNKPIDEAYNNAIETERTTAFSTSLEWHECLHDVFKAYQRETEPQDDVTFQFHYLVVLCNLTYLRLRHKDVVESAEALHSFDCALQTAINVRTSTEAWDAVVTEMQGQLFFLAGTLLLKRAQKGSVSWADVRPLAAVLYMLCQTVTTVDAQAIWYVRPPQDREKMYSWLYKMSFFRISQSGHTLHTLLQGDPASWAQRLQQQCCSPVGQERAYEMLFPLRDMRAGSRDSYLANTHKFCNSQLYVPTKRQLYDVDRVAHLIHPDQLSELVWLCLQRCSYDEPHQPDYNFKLFDTLPYNARNVENGASETLCQIDTEAFLYATVRCTARAMKQMSSEEDSNRPVMLPLCLCKLLCSKEQQEWWSAAYNFCSNTIKDNFSRMRLVLQRGIEAVRLIGNHGLGCAMMVHLAKTFDAKVKSLVDGDYGNRASSNQLASLEARAALYWNHALFVLARLERSHRGPKVGNSLFEDVSDADLTSDDIARFLQDAKFAVAKIAMNEGRHEEALKGFENLKTPYASFYRAQILKSLAQQALEGLGPEETKQHRYAALIAEARDALYLTLDHLGGNKNHELNILLTRELDDVESKLTSYNWENDNSNKSVSDETSVLHTPTRNGRFDNDLGHSHSTPNHQASGKEVRQRLLLSQLPADTPGPVPQRLSVASPSPHPRPSPERMDAQIKSLNYSQTTLFKMVMDRNEELAVMYKSLVEELKENNLHLRKALRDNQDLMTDLKAELTANKDVLKTVLADLTVVKETVRQLKEEPPTAAASVTGSAAFVGGPGLPASAQVAPAGYLMGSPYHPAASYPPYGPVPSAPGYRYPLIPGYSAVPTPRPPAPIVASPRLSGTVPSSFGKFRENEVTSTEDDDDDEENIMSMLQQEYGEGLLQTPQYCFPSPDPLWQDLVTAGQGGSLPYSSHAQTPPVPAAAMPQPGYFTSALRGQALQYTSGLNPNLPMPGPGFFSSSAAPTSLQATVSQPAALGGKPAATPPTVAAQPIPVIGATAKPAMPATSDSGALISEAVLYREPGRLTTHGGEYWADVSVALNRTSKQGHIVVSKKNSGEVTCKHNIATVRITQSFNANCFIWSVNIPDKKSEDLYKLNFDSPDQVIRLRLAIEQVIKTAGIKPVPQTPALPARSPGLPSPQAQADTKSPQPATATPTPSVFGGKASPASTTVASIFSSAKPTILASPPAPAATTLTPSSATGAGIKATLGGFTFCTTPVVKQGEEPAKTVSPQLKLKESAIKVTSPTAVAATSAGNEGPKPFAGFTFTSSKPAAAGAVVTTAAETTKAAAPSTGPFVFGQASNSSPTFATLRAQATTTTEAFKAKEVSSSGFKASNEPILSTQPATCPTVKSPGVKDDEAVEEYEPSVDFKPVIELPDLVEVKTGEENERKVFADRVKLFRFDGDLNQWKERGVGELKILRAEDGARFRILMRRDQVLKVCANHYITPDMKLTPLATSDKAWCYTATDYAEQEMKVEKFAVKFKNSEKAGEFKTMFESCQKDIESAEKRGKAADKVEKTKLSTTGGQKSLAEMFKPAEGSWECPGCYVSNPGTDLRCVACQSLKPGAKADDAKAPSKENPFAATSAAGGFGGFKFGSEAVVTQSDASGFKFGGGKPAVPAPGSASAGGFKFGPAASSSITQTPAKPAPAASSSITQTPAKPAPAAEKKKGVEKSLVEMFKPSEGSWDCPTCLVVNKADLMQCPACQTTKPGANPQAVVSPAKEDPFAPAATSGFGGFQFGAATDKKETAGFKFGGFAQKTETPKFTAPTPASSNVGESTPSGFKFNLGTPSSKPGFTFGTKTTSVTTATTTATTGFSFGTAAKESASATTITSKDSASVPSAGFPFPKPQASSTPAQPAKSTGGSALLQQLLTSDDTPATLKPAASKPADTPAKPADTPTKPSLLAPAASGSTAGFQFTFSKEKKLTDPTSPKSPETDEHGFYLNKDGDDSHIYFEPVVPLPEKIEVKTGEEDEEVLFESRAKMYRFTVTEWKERGLGVIKILQHSQSGRIRVLMRREQVLKICCNHFITSDLELKPMPRSDGKAWVWYAMDFTDGEGQMEQLAVRFRDEDTASKFKKVFDESKDKMKTPSKMDSPCVASVVPSAADNTVSRKLFSRDASDDEVQFLYEEKPTEDQVRRARELLLPDTFYLYENRPDCPGCIGCEDYDPSRVSAAPLKVDQHRGAVAKTQKPDENKEESADTSLAGFPFGSKSSLSFSSLAAASTEGPGFGLKDSSKPFHWTGAGQKLFGRSSGAGAEAAEEGEEGDVVSSQDVHFEPVIPLPALVEVKTGEEDWTTLFSHRAKVYRFDGTQWKERGIGDIKISTHTTRLMFRVLLRREQVLKIACNHLISPSMELKPMATSETSWCWVAEDYTEGQPKMEQFAVKFKNVEIAKEFKSVFEDCQEKLEQGQSAEPVQETMVSSTQHVTGNRGNVVHTRALEASWMDAMTSAVQPTTGDKGNPYYSQQLDTSAQDTMVSSTQPATGDKGNPYVTRALDVAAQDAMVSTSTQPLGQRDEPNFSQLLGTDEGDAEQYGDYEVEEDDEEDDDDETDDDDVEAVELEKRVTLYSNEGGEWKNLGMGDLRVLYDDDLNANKIDVITDSGNQLCNHVIYQELSVSLNPTEKCCEWHPLDYSTDEPVKRQFKAKFSSLQAAQEFEAIFLQGLLLAKESGISQIIPEEIDVPEVFSTGD